MSFNQQAQNCHRERSELQIIGAITIDLNGVPDEARIEEISEETRARVAGALAKEFCSNSTIHGIRYFTEPKRHWLERIWWLIALVLSLMLCVFMMISIWKKWHYRPVIVSFNDRTTPIGMIPFPAVTICTTKKFVKGEIDASLFERAVDSMRDDPQAYKTLSSEQLNRFDAVINVCYSERTGLGAGLNISRTESIYKTISKIGPEKGSFVMFSTFIGQFRHVMPIITGEGLCYTFNSLNSRDIYTDVIAPELLTVEENSDSIWNAEDGYKSNVSDSDTYPFRVFGAGHRDSFFTILGINLDDHEGHQFCSEMSQGFRLSLHRPDQLPRLPDEFVFIPIEQETYISVKPHMITTSKGLHRYSPKARGCYFKSERQLRFFKSYSQQNCELECSANYTKKTCGCVKFSMPRDENTQVCTIGNLQCYIYARDKFSKELLVNNCDCLPDCTSITYDVEISQANTYTSESDTALKNALNESSVEVNSKLLVSFKENNFISVNRTESYTISDFVASCGGLLGLFMGVSMLSVIELIYYFTLRLCCNIKQGKSITPNTRVWVQSEFPTHQQNRRLI